MDYLDIAHKNVDDGDYDSAKNNFDKFKKDCYETAPILDKVDYWHLRGLIVFMKGNHGYAKEYFSEASSLLNKAWQQTLNVGRLYYYKIENLALFGDWYLHRAQYAKADEFYKEALNLHNLYVNFEHKYHPKYVEIRTHRAIASWKIEDLEEIFAEGQNFETALPLATRCSERPGTAQKGIDILNEVSETHKIPYDSPLGARICCCYALCYLQLGNRSEGKKFLTEAFKYFPKWHTLTSERGEHPDVFNTFMAMLCKYYSDMDSNVYNNCAIFYGKCGIVALESIREQNYTLDKESIEAFMHREDKLYDYVIWLLLQKNRYQEVQDISIRKKQDELFGYMLRDTSLWKQSPSSRDIPSIFTGNEQEQYRRLFELSDPCELEKYMEELPQNLAEMEGGKDQEDTPAIKNFLERRDDDSCLIQIITADMKGTTDVKDVMIVSRKGKSPIYHDISGKDIRKKAKDFHKLLSKNDNGKDPTPLEDLYIPASELFSIILGDSKIFQRSEVNYPKQWCMNMSVEPSVVDLSKIKTIYFALDGALRCLPISALYYGAPGQGQWLIQDYKLVEVPFSVLNQTDTGLEKTDVKASKSAFVSDDKRITGTNIRGELEKIGFKVDFGNEFTLTNLINAMNKSGWVHVFSHFLIDKDIEKSKLTLANEKETVSLRDLAEKLRSRTMAAKNIDFAACESALTPDKLDFECMGAFMMYYGASSVMGTLYKVNIEATALFMSEFYNMENESRASAFQLASEYLIMKHPYYWAGFVLLEK